MKIFPVRLVNSDRIKLAALVGSVLLLIGIGVGVNRVIFEHVLSLNAESTAQAWADNLWINAPELVEIVAGRAPSASAEVELDRSLRGSDVFRIRIWDIEQHQLYYRGRMLGATETKNIVEDCGPKRAREVLEGGVCSILAMITLPGNPKHVGRVYFPVLKNGQTVGVLEVYVDLTSYVEKLGKSFLAVQALAALTALLAGSIPLVLVQRKMRAHRAAQLEAEFLAGHDPLTGIPNRKRVAEIAMGALALGRRNKSSVAAIMLDLDRFKAVNDDYGHAPGDELLRQFARRIRAAIREEDTVARLGGDEFVVLLVGIPQPNGVQAMAERMLAALQQPYTILGMRIACGTSIGVAIAPDDGEDWDHLLSSADAALYRSKATGRNRICYFQRGMEEKLRERRRIELDMQKAMETQAFHLAYQPIFGVGSEELQGFEALLRWPEGWAKHSPEEFIPIAEDCGLMPELGAWVLKKACAAAAQWKHPLQISVNLSPVQFRQGNILTVVREALAESSLKPERLELEITESLWIENTDAVLRQLEELQRLGVMIALDDFGTGYSSLKYLWKFPFNRVKIDRSFVEGSEHDPKAAAIIDTITALGRALHLSISAEGVETDAQARKVRESGCDAVQGFLYSRPLTADQAWQMVERM
jgi:diguanylate cyclase (GGDEF)-like protein